MIWQPMATRGREKPMSGRDWFDTGLIIAAIIVVAYLVGRFVP